MAGMALDPFPFDLVLLHRLIQRLHQPLNRRRADFAGVAFDSL